MNQIDNTNKFDLLNAEAQRHEDIASALRDAAKILQFGVSPLLDVIASKDAIIAQQTTEISTTSDIQLTP